MDSTHDPENSRLQALQYAQRVHSYIKNPCQYACMGFLAEPYLIRIMEAAGVKVFRAWEGAPNDGAWLDEEAEQSQTSIPDLKTPAVEKWEWAINAKESHFLTFDIKYRSTGTPDSLGNLTTRHNWYGNAEIFLLCFQGLPKYIAILPRLVARKILRWKASGIAHLISRAPPWVYPFMVHEEHLKEAVYKLLECARTGRCYQNPSTSVKLLGWTPKLQTSPSLSPSGKAQESQDSMQAIREFWDLIKHVNPSVTYDFIPIAPLVADFLLTIQNVTVRIEHKVGYIRDDGALAFRRNPFFGGFQWHYIIIQPSADRQKWYCFARHHVPQEWRDNPTDLYIPSVELDKWVYEEGAGRDVVRAILNYICKTAHAAIQNAKASLQNEESIDDIESLLPVDFLPDDDESDSDDEGSDDEGDSLSKRRDLTGLHWLLEPLNQQCRDSGQLVLIPLDLGHPFGTHIVVKHSWTSEDKEKWDQDRTLPIYGFSPGIADRPCVVMRFWDLCPSLGQGKDHPKMKQRYWLRPFVEQPFLILGSLLPDPKDRITSSHYSPYLFLPSGFTTYFQLKDFRDWGINVGHPGSGYYRSEKQVLHPQWPTQSYKPLRFDRFMKIGTNPEDYILNFQDGSIYKQLLRLINGTEEKMSIRNPQSFDHHPTSFSKKEYLTTVGKVMQASWDYGLQRKPANPLGGKKKGYRKKGESSTTASVSKSKLSAGQPDYSVKGTVDNSTAADISRDKGKGVDRSKKATTSSFKAAASTKTTREGPKGGSKKDQTTTYLSKGPSLQQRPMAAPLRSQSSKVLIRTSKSSQDRTNIETNEDK